MNEREALKLALETAEGIVKSDWRKWQELASPDEFERWVKSRALHMATAIKEALAQPEQEPKKIPESWATHGGLWIESLYKHQREDRNKSLSTAPPQRTWVGLTDEEIDDLFEANGNETTSFFWVAFARAIEAKLKEKNFQKGESD